MFLKAYFFIFLVVFSGGSFAACSAIGNLNRISYLPLSGTVSVSPSTANGTVLKRFTSVGDQANTQANANVSCAPNQTEIGYYDFFSTPRPVSSYSSNVYQTGVAGIGVRLLNDSGVSYSTTKTYKGNAGVNNSIYGNAVPYFTVEFVKIGPIASGEVSSVDIPLGKLSLGRRVNIYSLSTSGSVSFVVSGCQISVPNVSLGTHQLSELSNSNFTERPASFNITMSNCPQTVPIRYQIDQITGYANQSQSVVNVTGGATGVGVQLLQEDGITPSPMGSQQLIGSGSLAYTLAFKARYFKTGTKVGPGAANATMGLTLFYQ